MHELEISEIGQIELYFKQRLKSVAMPDKTRKLLVRELLDSFHQGIKFRRDGMINVKLEAKDVLV